MTALLVLAVVFLLASIGACGCLIGLGLSLRAEGHTREARAFFAVAVLVMLPFVPALLAAMDLARAAR